MKVRITSNKGKKGFSIWTLLWKPFCPKTIILKIKVFLIWATLATLTLFYKLFIIFLLYQNKYYLSTQKILLIIVITVIVMIIVIIIVNEWL